MASGIVRVNFTQPKENTSQGSLNLLLALGSAEESCTLLTLGLGALVGAKLQKQEKLYRQLLHNLQTSNQDRQKRVSEPQGDENQAPEDDIDIVDTCQQAGLKRARQGTHFARRGYRLSVRSAVSTGDESSCERAKSDKMQASSMSTSRKDLLSVVTCQGKARACDTTHISDTSTDLRPRKETRHQQEAVHKQNHSTKSAPRSWMTTTAYQETDHDLN